MDEATSGADITVRIPGLLARFTEGARSVAVTAPTVGGSLDGLLDAYPALHPHLFDDRGRLRPHLKLFHNGVEVRSMAADEIAVLEGDEVVVLQAVSGG